MTISLGATKTTSGNKASASTFTTSHTVDANTQTLVVMVSGIDSSATDSVVSEITWDGTALGSSRARYRSGNQFFHTWHLQNPTAKTANIVVTMGGTCTDVQATIINLLSSTSAGIGVDNGNEANGASNTVGAITCSCTKGAVALGQDILVSISAVTAFGVTSGKGTLLFETDMGSQCVGTSYGVMAATTAELGWTTTGTATVHYMQIVTFRELGPSASASPSNSQSASPSASTSASWSASPSASPSASQSASASPGSDITCYRLEDFQGNEYESNGRYNASTWGDTTRAKSPQTKSFRVYPTTTGTGAATLAAYASPNYADAGTPVFGFSHVAVKFDFLFLTKPSSGSEEIVVPTCTSYGPACTLRLNSSGKLEAYAKDGTTLLATGSVTLSADTWYKIELEVVCATTGLVRVLVDGTQDISVSGNTLQSDQITAVSLGKYINRNGQSVEYYFANFVMSDMVLSDIGSGNFYIKRRMPTGDGATHDWHSGTGTTFAECDEIGSDLDTTYLQSSGAVNQLHLFTYEATDDNNTIIAVGSAAHCSDPGANTGALKLRTIFGGTTVDPTSGYNIPNGWNTTYQNWQRKYWSINPDTGGSFTKTQVDGIINGVLEENAVATRCSNAYLMVLYRATNPSTSSSPSTSVSASPSASPSTSTSASPSASASTSPSTSVSASPSASASAPPHLEDAILFYLGGGEEGGGVIGTQLSWSASDLTLEAGGYEGGYCLKLKDFQTGGGD